MSRGINKVILVGNLGADPEVRFMPNGQAVANVSLATSEAWRDKQTNELQERTEWHRVVLYRRLAEVIGEYARKGSKVYIEGKIRTRKWQDQAGADRYTTEIHADELQLLDRASGANQGEASAANGGYSKQQANPQAATADDYSRNAPPAADFNDDIPF